jgi:hypothetical protein
MKPWPEEALIEGWFPLYAQEQRGFDIVEDVIESSSYEERQSFELASGSIVNSERVADRVTIGDRRDCQLNPDKPRRTCRLRADAYVKENRGRTGEICLDTTFHRSHNNPPISSLTRLRRHASLVGSCTSAHIRMPRVLAPGSSAFVGVEFS